MSEFKFKAMVKCQMSNVKCNSGFIALITVLIISAVTIVVATTTIFLGISESLLGFSADQSHEALQLAESCAEETYFRLKKDASFPNITPAHFPYTLPSGSNLILGNGECDINVSGIGSGKTIVSSSSISTTISDFNRRIITQINLVSNTDTNGTTTNITSWSE